MAATKRKSRPSPARNRSSETLEVSKPDRSRARRGPVKGQYASVDLHLHRSLVVRDNHAGEELGVERIDNSPMALAEALADAGPNPEVAIEATYGWYWAVDVLQELGATVHLVNPSGLGQSWEGRRVKNDYKDCRELIDRMRLHKLPEAWIAPPELREVRALVRYRAKLVHLRN